MSETLVLAGNAITASILKGYLDADDRFEIAATVVDAGYEARTNVKDVPNLSLETLSESFNPKNVKIMLAIGYGDLNKNREAMADRLEKMGYSILTYIHPDANVYTHEPLGRGTVVLPNAVIEPHAKVGRNVMLWCNTTIGHHSDVGNNCWVASGTVVAGHASVGNNTFLGVNATIANQVSVGKHNIIGAGALITKETKDSTVHLARSAEPLRYSAEDYSRLILK